MNLSELTATSPIDGRYRNKTESLAPYFSEFGLIKYRVQVEVEYFIALCDYKIPQLDGVDRAVYPQLRDLYLNFKEEDALRIKEIEKVTNHDVKAVEYFIKEAFEKLGLSDYKEFIHFGLTSQDINNTATPLSLKEGIEQVYLPKLEQVLAKINELAKEYEAVPMLAKTHGQPASPTRLGKEFMVFSERISKQIKSLRLIPYSAKFGGATGNFNAHKVAYPDRNWVEFANAFVNNVLTLDRSQITTQIEHYDHIAALFDNVKRINTILVDLSRDIWMYISAGYFKQKIKKGEVGSSAMPHKVNPIDFENAEGNLGISSALCEHLAVKLPVSRLQRDLTDSTVLRNVGVPLGHSLIALESLVKGLNKLLLNEEALEQDLEDNWAVVAEAIQTILRREAYPNPYETLKELTRTNSVVNKESIANFIDTLSVSDTIKEELKRITPQNYTGV